MAELEPDVEVLESNDSPKVGLKTQNFYPKPEQRQWIYNRYRDIYKSKKGILSKADYSDIAARYNKVYPTADVPATGKAMKLQIKNARSSYNEVLAKKRQKPWPYFGFFNEFWGECK